MEPKKPILKRQQDAKVSMDDLHSKFASRLQKPKNTVSAPNLSTSSSKSIESTPTSTPSTSSGFINNPMMNGTEASPGREKAAKSTSSTSENNNRHCLLCKTKLPLNDQSFVSHLLGKKHHIMDYKQTRTKLQKEERDRRTVHVSGFPTSAHCEEICKLFVDLGMIDFQWFKRHAFVEFGNRAEAIAALKSPVTYRTKRLSLAPRTARSHADDVVEAAPLDTLLTSRVKTSISESCESIDQLTTVLQQLLISIQLRGDEYETRHYVRGQVASLLRAEFPAVECHIFGSSANNLGFSGADVDLYAELGYNPYDAPRQADGEAAAARLVAHLAKIFRRQYGVSNVQAIPRARVPIVKFCMHGISVDLSFRNAMPTQNTALIRLFTSAHPSIRPYMMFIRFWAKTQNIAGGGKPATLLTNYALTMLMAFVVMCKKKILPPVAELRNSPYKRVIINGWNCGFSEIIPRTSHPMRNYSIFELALDFFDYYANLDASLWVICPLLGRLVSKEDMKSKYIKRLPGLEDYCRVDTSIQHDTPLCVQDPFDLIHNVTRGLTKIPLERFQLLCRRSSVILRKIVALQLPPRALFDAIELSDDVYSSDVRDSERLLVSQDQSGQDEGIVPEIIELDPGDSDLSQDVEILEEVSNLPSLEPEQITLDDDDSTQGVKRSLTDDSGFSDAFPPANSSTNAVPSLDQKTFLSQLSLDSPFLYKFQVPSDKVVDINMNTGALTCKQGNPSAEDVRWSGLNMVIFVLQHIFAANVISRVTEGESPSKKMKGPNPDSINCFAILLVTFKHDLAGSRRVMESVTPSFSSSSESPFTCEKALTDRLLKNMPKKSQNRFTTAGPYSAQFFVCYRACKANELLLVANTSIMAESAKGQLESFLNDFGQMTEKCVQRAVQHLDRAK